MANVFALDGEDSKAGSALPPELRMLWLTTSSEMAFGKKRGPISSLFSLRRRRWLLPRILRSVRRGCEFAKRVCQRAMPSWTAVLLKPDLKQLHETRNRQTIHPDRPNVLAA
jgi:hypothetical protein